MVRLTSDQLQSMGIEALGARRKLLKVFHMVRRALGEDIPESERLEDEEEASSGSPTVSTSEEAAVTKSVAEMSMSTPPQTPEKSGPAASIKN